MYAISKPLSNQRTCQNGPKEIHEIAQSSAKMFVTLPFLAAKKFNDPPPTCTRPPCPPVNDKPLREEREATGSYIYYTM